MRDALQRDAGPQVRGTQDDLNNDQDDDDPHDDGNADGEANGEDDGDGGPEPVFNLPPPPEGNYPSQEDLEKSIHAWSLEHGYEMVRRASKKNANGVIYKRYHHCSKHGKLANTSKLTDTTRTRTRRKSNRTGCPMSLAAVAIDPTNPAGEWQIRHRKTHHNHGPLDALGLAGHRRRARMGGVERAMDGLFRMGTPTTQVIQFLQRTHPDGLFTRTDVANMKLKWKKYGTCVHNPGQYSKEGDGIQQRPPGRDAGRPSACSRCRAKKQRCDSARPVCGQCVEINTESECHYDHPPPPGGTGPPGTADEGLLRPATASTSPNIEANDVATTSAPVVTTRGGRRPQTQLGVQRAQAEQILQDLQSFQADHVKPKRLDLNSSSVEILAQSSCGNLDSYKNIPTLYAASEWQAFSDAFLEASLKENTFATLMGEKSGPPHPLPQAGEAEVDIEDWNEYIKRTAIYHRRNGALLGALWGNVAPAFRTRINNFKSASQAWSALEDMCCPRGSDQAWNLYTEMTEITLDVCGGDVQEYITRIETAWHYFLRLRMSSLLPQDRVGRHRADLTSGIQGRSHTTASASMTSNNAGTSTLTSYSSNAMSPADVFPEESLCLLFLKNLGEGYRRWVDTLCMTSNIGGFGTGMKLGFHEVAKKALEFEAGQKNRGNGGGR